MIRLTEIGLNRIMKHGENGFVIVSTARSVVVPSTEDGSYDFDSWQSLFGEYVNYCIMNKLPICEDTGGKSPQSLYKMDLGAIQNLIKDKNWELNNDSTKEFLKWRNKNSDTELYSYLKSSKNYYTFTPTYGGFRGQHGEDADFEPNFIVYNSLNEYKAKSDSFATTSWEHLKSWALRVCQKYKQDAIYAQAPGKAPVYLDKDGTKINVSESLNFTFNQNNAYFTTNKRSKVKPHTFTADINFIESLRLRPHIPGSLLDKMKWSQYGEIWDLNYEEATDDN